MRTAALALALIALPACGGTDNPQTSGRCEAVHAAADEQAVVAQTALDHANAAKGNSRRAEAAHDSAAKASGYPGTPELNAAEYRALRDWNAAQDVAAAAVSEAEHESRLVMQIIIGDTDCFAPVDVAKAREALNR